MEGNQFQFSLTAADLAEAYAKGRRRARKKLLNWKTAAFIVAVMALTLGSSLWNDWIAPSSPSAPPPTTAPVAPLSSVWLPLVPWIVIFAFVFFVVRRLLRSQYKKHRLIDRPQVLTVDAETIIWAEPFSRLEYQWPAFFSFEESANLFLLYVTDPKASGVLMFHMVPKRAFGTTQSLAEFRSLLESNVHPRAGAFPVIPLASLATNQQGQNDQIDSR